MRTVLSAWIVVFCLVGQGSTGDWMRRTVCATLLGLSTYTYVFPLKPEVPEKKNLDPNMVDQFFAGDADMAHRQLTEVVRRPPAPFLSKDHLLHYPLAPVTGVLDSSRYRFAGASVGDALWIAQQKGLHFLTSYFALILLLAETRRQFFYVPLSDYLARSNEALKTDADRVVIIDALFDRSIHQDATLTALRETYRNHPDVHVIRTPSWAELVKTVHEQLTAKGKTKTLRFEICITGAPGHLIFPSGERFFGETLPLPQDIELQRTTESVEARLTLVSSTPTIAIVERHPNDAPLIDKFAQLLGGTNILLVSPYRPVQPFPNLIPWLQMEPKSVIWTTLGVGSVHVLGLGLLAEMWHGQVVGFSSTQRLSLQEYEVHRR